MTSLQVSEHLAKINNMSYDEQIECLTQYPEAIYHSWNASQGLFKAIRGDSFVYDLKYSAGCLTQIRVVESRAAFVNGKVDINLTKEIREDARIPTDPFKITAEDLPVFKEWQERIDLLQTTKI